MTTADKRSINMEHDNIETVQCLELLGSRIDSNGDCTEEVKERLTFGKESWRSELQKTG